MALSRVGFALMFILGCESHQKQREPEVLSMPGHTRSHVWLIQWASRDDGKVVVAFIGNRVNTSLPSSLLFASDKGLLVRKPDGTKKTVEGGVLEYIDGEYREFPDVVTVEELQGFFKSFPNEYSRQALARFLETHRR